MLILVAAGVGCEQTPWRAGFEQWPLAATSHEGEQVFAHAEGPVTIAVEPSTVMQVGDQIISIAPSPRDGFLVFCTRTLIHLRHHGGVWSSQDFSPIEHTVRQAVPLASERLALLTAGDSRSRAEEPLAEPAPWLREGVIRLAWLDGDELIIGEPELGPEINPYRIKSGRFGGEAENLLVFVYTRAPFDTVMRPRPWIYRVIEGDVPRLEPRWRGTSFSHPFRDATFGDLTGEGVGEIAALEVARDGGRLLTAYRFKGFGLEGLAQSIELPEVEDRLEVLPRAEGSDQLVVRATDGRYIFFALDAEDGRLREVRTIDGSAEVRGWTIASTDRATATVFCVLPGGGTWQAGLEE